MDDLELLSRSRADVAPSPETVARHRRALAEAIEPVGPELHPAPEQPGRRSRKATFAVAALVLAGIAAVLSRGDDDITRVVTAPPAAQATTTTTLSPGTIVPCGSRLPEAISERPYDHTHEGADPASIAVRIYACRLDRALPETLTGPDGHIRKMLTTLAELMTRFGGLEGSLVDGFGRAHPISLAPLAGADPHTTAVGVIWSERPLNAPPLPPGLPPPPPMSPSLLPPWLEPGRRCATPATASACPARSVPSGREGLLAGAARAVAPRVRPPR